MKLLTHSTISQRLGFGFFLMVALLIGVVVFSLSQLQSINSEINRITGERMQRLEAIQALLSDINSLAQAAEAAVVATGEGGKKTLASLIAKVKAGSAALMQGGGTADGDDTNSEALRGLAAAKGQFESSLGKLDQFVGQGDSAQALDELLGNFAKTRQQLTRELGKQREHEIKRIADARDGSARSYAFAVKFMVAVSLGAILIAVVAGIYITRSVTVPLNEVLRATEDLRAGEGDLTFRLPGLKAEFGQLSESLNGFIRKLHDIIATVSGVAHSVNHAAGEIASGHNDLAFRTDQQAESLQSTAANVEELAATVKHNAENAQQARTLSADASAVAQKGGVVIGDVVRHMNQISDTSRRVADIVGVIDSIAFQTNILALNAAVEAARAGEQGRGFAVVATEVRSLAQRSAAAAREIKSLIEDSLTSVATGSRAVADAGETMQHVVSSIRSVSDLIAEVSVASQEQSAGIERVNRSITGMEEDAQRNAAMVEEASAATASLEDQSLALARAVGVFKLHADQAPTEQNPAEDVRGGRAKKPPRMGIPSITSMPLGGGETRLPPRI